MSWPRRHADGLLAAGLGLVVALTVVINSTGLGLTRDEGYYFDAAERYAGWFRRLGSDPARAFGDPVIRRHFEVNREHPVLVKNLMALSYLAFAPGHPNSSWPPEQRGGYVRAMRLPAALFSALAVVLVYLLGLSLAGRRVGLLAALMFWLAPRHFYHAGLACLDMPACATWLLVIYAWRRSRGSLKWSLLTGLFWGLAISTKHNGFFLVPVLGLHWLVAERGSFSFRREGFSLPRIPLAFFAMAVLGPLVFFLHWPFLWHHTVERLGWYFGFHLHHVNYYWEYFGTLLTDPPFPWLYPFAVTALTLPAPTLLLGLVGLLAVLGQRLGRPLAALGGWLGRFAGLEARSRPGPDWCDDRDGWLLLVNAFVPLLVIAVPAVPIFGGMKHWLHAMPFFCLLGALALEHLLRSVLDSEGPRRAAFAVVSALVLLPSVLGLLHVGNYGTSYYNALAGGIDGAADLGMQRQYWSNNVSGVLDWVNENAPPRARVYLHEVNPECFRTYQRDGYLRPDLRMGWSPDTADVFAYQYHREFVDAEYRAWNRLGHSKPAWGLYLDEVPLLLVYRMR